MRLAGVIVMAAQVSAEKIMGHEACLECGFCADLLDEGVNKYMHQYLSQ